jgi:hypothetical protein
MFENRVLSRTAGSWKKEVAAGKIKLCIEGLHKFYAHVACMEKIDVHAQIWSDNLKRVDHLEDLAKDRRVIWVE